MSIIALYSHMSITGVVYSEYMKVLYIKDLDYDFLLQCLNHFIVTKQ